MQAENITEAFNKIHAEILANPDKVRSLATVFEFEVSDGDVQTWIINCKDALGVSREPSQADCKFSLSKEDLLDIFNGRANPQALYLTGRLRLSGNVFKALELAKLFS